MCWLLVLLEVCGVLLVFWLKSVLSSPRLGDAQLIFGLVVNSIFIWIYMQMIQHDDFPFLGYRPDIFEFCSFAGWFTFVCIFVHGFAIPAERKVRFLFGLVNCTRRMR